MDIERNDSAMAPADFFDHIALCVMIGGIDRREPAQPFLHTTTFWLVVWDFQRWVFRGMARHGVIWCGV